MSDLRIVPGGARDMDPLTVLRTDNVDLRRKLAVAMERIQALETRAVRSEVALAVLADRSETGYVEILDEEAGRVMEERELQAMRGPQKGTGKPMTLFRTQPAGTADEMAKGPIHSGSEDADA